MSDNQRMFSAMRSTGALHLGHYYGVLTAWVKYQHAYECFFAIADLHALTTHYERSLDLPDLVIEVAIDWLAAGVNPNVATLFVQSHVPAHTELALHLGMITPLAWLERVPTYKEQMQKLKELDLSTYGFLGYPVLQAADILLYGATQVPVGEDQVPHIELTREIARRFNFCYGREADYQALAEHAIEQLGSKKAKLYRELKANYQQQGDKSACETAIALVESESALTLDDKERLMGYLYDGGKRLLVEPHALLTQHAKLPGLDGEKMSKSYGNMIHMRESTQGVTEKIKHMPTDPARVRRSDPGDPSRCGVWTWHQIYSDAQTQSWVESGCKAASIGCVECKQCLLKPVLEQQSAFAQAAAPFEQDHDLVRDILKDGARRANEVAGETLAIVREAVGVGG